MRIEGERQIIHKHGITQVPTTNFVSTNEREHPRSYDSILVDPIVLRNTIIGKGSIIPRSYDSILVDPIVLRNTIIGKGSTIK